MRVLGLQLVGMNNHEGGSSQPAPATQQAAPQAQGGYVPADTGTDEVPF